MNLQVFLLVFFLIFSLALLCALCWPYHGPAQVRAAAKIRTTLQHHLRPRCPDDGPACRLASTPASGAGPAPVPVRPWNEVKSRRGAPKRRDTTGFACPNPLCPYFTKILPVLQLGPCTQTMAHLLIPSLRQILAPG